MEKPGAPTVTELQGMKDEAEAAGVGVLMGYNKVRYSIFCGVLYNEEAMEAKKYEQLSHILSS